VSAPVRIGERDYDGQRIPMWRCTCACGRVVERVGTAAAMARWKRCAPCGKKATWAALQTRERGPHGRFPALASPERDAAHMDRKTRAKRTRGTDAA
jgi:hypothetical protein